jgi:hypothetical protein
METEAKAMVLRCLRRGITVERLSSVKCWRGKWMAVTLFHITGVSCVEAFNPTQAVARCSAVCRDRNSDMLPAMSLEMDKMWCGTAFNRIEGSGCNRSISEGYSAANLTVAWNGISAANRNCSKMISSFEMALL